MRTPTRDSSSKGVWSGPSPLVALAAAGLVALAVRLAIVATLPDADTDAYGHFAIGRALLAQPGSLVAHWVWLPGYHYAIWVMLHLGATFPAVRVVNALLQAGAPVLLYDFVARREGGDDPGRDRRAALLAAIAWTLAPLPNVLATSAQAETAFTLLVLASAWAVERRRSSLAGALLAVACLFRYEAWGAIPALAIHRILRKNSPIGVASVAIPLAAVVAWIALRRGADGEWLAFVRQTREFAGGVRGTTGFPPFLDALWFPMILPAIVTGPAILLVPIGLGRSIRAGWLVPGGLLAFLLASYAGRGALGLDRYFTALAPFACVALADGALRLPELARRVTPRVAAAAALVAIVLTTGMHLGSLARRSLARGAELRGYEASVSR